ncbi:MAG: type I 3-dehydroquinate dehydratase [Clostridiales bacterium]|nr:type I 3-dehydroquinate dehydratase [Clostridiales bacterium]
MQTPFDVKGVRFGEGRPVICVPVVEREKDAVIQKIRALTEKHVQMIEWRADCFARMDQPEQVRAVLEEIRPFVRDTVMLFTIRTRQQGGQAETDEKNILYLNEIAAKSGSIDMVDLEFFEATRPQREIRRLQRLGVRVIASHHDFQATPDERILHMLMDQMKQGGADVAKLAVMPQTADDVIRILKLTNDTRQRYPGLPIVTMSMGGTGVISRVAGEAFGSCITFGADGEVSAPGQMQMDVLAGILDALHDSITGGDIG